MAERLDHHPHVLASEAEDSQLNTAECSTSERVGQQETELAPLRSSHGRSPMVFWKDRFSIIVPLDTYGAHLALERTFLGYLKISLALSIIGITAAKLFRLQHSLNPDTRLGYYALGKPLSYICQGPAIYTLLKGAFRTWRTQNALVRGKAISGGFEISLLSAGIFLVMATFFVLIVVDIRS